MMIPRVVRMDLALFAQIWTSAVMMFCRWRSNAVPNANGSFTGADNNPSSSRLNHGEVREWMLGLAVAGSDIAGYSCLNASMGFRMAALNAGMMPKTIPVPAEQPRARATAHQGTSTETMSGCNDAIWDIA